MPFSKDSSRVTDGLSDLGDRQFFSGLYTGGRLPGPFRRQDKGSSAFRLVAIAGTTDLSFHYRTRHAVDQPGRTPGGRNKSGGGALDRLSGDRSGDNTSFLPEKGLPGDASGPVVYDAVLSSTVWRPVRLGVGFI